MGVKNDGSACVSCCESVCVCMCVILHSKEREKVPRDERGRFVCERGGEFGLLETVTKKVDRMEKKGGVGV